MEKTGGKFRSSLCPLEGEVSPLGVLGLVGVIMIDSQLLLMDNRYISSLLVRLNHIIDLQDHLDHLSRQLHLSLL